MYVCFYLLEKRIMNKKFQKKIFDNLTKTPPGRKSRRAGVLLAYRVAAMTALMVCIRFSASSKTMEALPRNTWSVTSRASRPNFS